ncbi:cyun116 [Cyclophragma undans nucleopolyhedrovirus]|uniref:Cyun116 n=1 Tax=Cyclophragma undans nucleopolyhedrovirus TaxID=1906244 RepID=A0A288QYT4_9ABAC|nr:cyun116 [Cyclophragma undans nucleopolyhedrovirus]AOT85574.1 cyun116 [Cyclophragma undans nucleopolyhedrovirus]
MAAATAGVMLKATPSHPTPKPRIISLQHQLEAATAAASGNNANYKTDLQKMIDTFAGLGVPAGHLGEVLDNMGRRGQLMPKFQDDAFEVVQKRQLAPETIKYLNYLENDKLFQCRLCYTHADWLWCDFHRAHVYRSPDRSLDNVHYVQHLNSDMGVVMLVEEYFFHLSSFNNKHEAKRALKCLTDFETLSSLMESFNYYYANGDEPDVNAYELMDFE